MAGPDRHALLQVVRHTSGWVRQLTAEEVLAESAFQGGTFLERRSCSDARDHASLRLYHSKLVFPEAAGGRRRGEEEKREGKR